MRSTLRQKKFKRYLFSEEELQARASALAAAMEPLERAWRGSSAPPAEIVAQYIYNFLHVLRPKDFLGGPHSQNLRGPMVMPANSLALSSVSQGDGLTEVPILLRLPHYVSLFATHSFRSTPLAVNRSLVAWAEGRVELHLLDYIPTAYEVLKAQAQFARIVTCFLKPAQLTVWVEGHRDPLGFVMHDLIHADHFFHDRELACGQQIFYKEVLARYESGEFSALLERDRQFAAEFDYVIGDMNSHPEHLRQTLNKIIELAIIRAHQEPHASPAVVKTHAHIEIHPV